MSYLLKFLIITLIVLIIPLTVQAGGGGTTVTPCGGECTTLPTDTACGTDKIGTALGCIPKNPGEMINGFLQLSIGVSGAIALLLMITGAFRMLTSSGNPGRIKAGRDQFTSAAIGLVFVIFSVLLLQFVGVDILNLPGLGR